MIKAAGILFLTDAGEALFLKRGNGSDHPGEWCFPGGQLEGDETAEQAAEREAIEELGSLPDGKRVLLTRRIAADNLADPIEVDYTTFLQRVGNRFDPQVNGEHTGFAWARPDEPPEPLHPGCRIAVQRLKMNELGVAQAMAAGELVSPQRYENMTLFALRITGTDTAYRRSLDEFAYRRPENYLTPEFLQRCQGLPVIWEHPEKSLLDSKEYSRRAIGAIMLPYFQGNEVWGIARIQDDEAAREMTDTQLSTSPAVHFEDPTVNRKVALEDGATLLIEGDPSLIDHLAICPQGVWDKGGSPAGVRSETRKDSIVAEEDDKKAREDSAKADAARMDAVLSGITSLTDSMAGLARRMDSFEEKEKAKADAEEKAKCDAEEASAKEKADADEKEKEEDEKKKADAARSDSDKRIADLQAERDADRARLKALEAMIPKQVADSDRSLLADAQARADSVYTGFGTQAPAPLLGELPVDYRIRLAKGVQEHSTAWKSIDLAAVAKGSEAALAVAETSIYADAVIAARNPDGVAEGQLRAIVRQDETGRRITSFVGDPSAWMGEFRSRPRMLEKPYFRTQTQKGN